MYADRTENSNYIATVCNICTGINIWVLIIIIIITAVGSYIKSRIFYLMQIKTRIYSNIRRNWDIKTKT